MMRISPPLNYAALANYDQEFVREDVWKSSNHRRIKDFMANMLLITRGSGGDLDPFLRISSELKARGHDVTLITHGYYERVVKEAGLGFAGLDRAEDFVENLPITRKMGDLVAGLRDGLSPIASMCKRFGDLVHSEATVLVTHHNSHVAGQILSEKHQVPLVSVFTAPAFAANMPIYEKMYSIAAEDINRVRTAVGLLPVQDWRSWWRGIRWSMGLWPEWFAPPDPAWPPDLSPVGFVLKQDASDELPGKVRAMLEDDVRPVLITHGTSIPPANGFFEASAKACQRLGRPGILVTRHPRLVPHPLPEGVELFEYVPSLAAIMPHMAAVIHHGGMGVVGQTLTAGVPQVVLAVGIDRPDNGFRLRRLGVGEYLPPRQWQPDTIAEALNRLIGSAAVWERCATLSAKLVGTDPIAAACAVIEECLQKRDEVGGPVPGTVPEDTHRPDQVGPKKNFEECPMTDTLCLSPERRALLAQMLEKQGKL